jgi:hypothetical protein
MKEREVILRLLGPADQQATKPIQPTVRPLYDPAMCFLSCLPLLHFFTA